MNHEIIFSTPMSHEGSEDIGYAATSISNIVRDACSMHASDIHIQPTHDQALVRLRCDGILRLHTVISLADAAMIIARCKILSELDSCQTRFPQDGTMRFSYAGTWFDARLSTFPTLYGEKMVMRLLPHAPRSTMLHGLGLSPSIVTTLEEVAKRQQGMFLVTGPTGSGKTTTLYALLHEIDAQQRNVVTLEDPIEYRLPLVSHSQINEAIGFTFPVAMRALLRQDPDVALIGEIRDGDTARTAFEAALTGHLVLSSLHTIQVAAVPLRLRKMGVEASMMAQSLIGILGQRLIPALCLQCRWSRPVNAATQAWAAKEGVVLTDEWLPGGCVHCQGTGFAGRVVVTERLMLNQALCAALGQGEGAWQEAVNGTGERSLLYEGLQCAAEGTVALREIRGLERLRS